MFFGRSSFITIIVCSFFDFYSVLCFFPQFLSVFFFSQYSSFRVFIRKDDDNKIGAFHLVLRLEVHIVLLSKAIHRKRLQSTHTQNEASKKSERKSYRRKIKVRKSFARTPRSIVACPYSLCCDLNASTVFYDWQCPCSETMPIFFFDLFALSSFLFFPPSVTLSHTRKRWRKKKRRTANVIWNGANKDHDRWRAFLIIYYSSPACRFFLLTMFFVVFSQTSHTKVRDAGSCWFRYFGIHQMPIGITGKEHA